jgi:DHA2 family multidrug resistance protein
MQITLDKGQQVDWFGAVWLRWFTGISVASFLGFIFWELHTPEPVVNLRIFKNRNFAIGCVLFAVFGAAIYGLIALQPLFLQTLMGYTALDAGMTVSPRGLGALAAMFLVGVLVQKINPRYLAAFGFTMFGLSALLLSRLNLQVSMRNIVLPNVINGFGAGFIFVPITTFTLGTLRNDQVGNAAGIQNLLRNVGGSIGISFISTMLERYAQAHQVFMAGRISPLNPVYRQHVAILQKVFEAHFSPADALQHAQAVIYGTLLQQASYWAFVQLFYDIAWACVICFVGVLFLRRVKAMRPVAVH